MYICIFMLMATFLYATPKAIVFDFGGVMTSEWNREAVVRFIRDSLLISDEEFERLNQEKHRTLKEGMTDVEFWTTYAQDRGIALPYKWEESLRSVMKDAIGINSKMYQLVDELKELKIAVALLSNINERHSKLVRDLGLYEPFDPCLLSWEMGVEKPDPEAYEFLLRELRLAAHNVLFIDDRVENIEGAKRVGIDAILFESEEHLRSALIQRKVLPFLPI